MGERIPAVAKEARTAQLNVRIKPAIRQRAQTLAKASGLSLATVTERGINKQFAEHRARQSSWTSVTRVQAGSKSKKGL